VRPAPCVNGGAAMQSLASPVPVLPGDPTLTQRFMAKLVLRDTLAVRYSGADLEREVKKLQGQRRIVQIVLWACMVSVLVLELQLPEMLVNNSKMAVELIPVVSVRLIGYLVVAWLLSDRLRDRFGFGLAIGIGLLQFLLLCYAMVTTLEPGRMSTVETVVLALMHLVLAGVAVRTSLAYPQDSRRWPWIVGAASALLFLVVLPQGAEALWRAASPAMPEEVRTPAAPTTALKAGVVALTSCASKYRAEHAAEGFPRDSAAFDAACVAGTTVATNPDSSWQFRYEAGAPDATGAVTDFVLRLRQNGNADMLPGRFTAGPNGEVQRPATTRGRPAAGRTPAPK
jgi:hypothetical protein